ncbi:MAG: MarR family transcriptional regulator [Betaproteobacteria bacterium]
MTAIVRTDSRRPITPDDLDCATDLMDVTPRVMGAMRAAMRQNVGNSLSVAQFRCLNFIGRHPGCSISALAEFIGVSLPSASANADRLVRAGLAQARASEVDRRRSELRVTTDGAALLTDVRQRAREALAAVLTEMSHQDVQGARAGLSVLRQVFVIGAGGASGPDQQQA